MLRGINQQQIFEDEEDNLKFLQILKECKEVSGFWLLAYCLMGNHVHLLIKEGNETLEQVFKRIGGRLVYWYNVKYQRVGHLFQDRFKSEPVDSDTYLLTVIRYIHQNPVKAAICNHPKHYKYSSYKDYYDNDLIDNSFVRSLVTDEFFFSFNCAENDDQCLDIDDERPRLNDERAAKIMKRLSGCSNVTEFQELDTEIRNDVLYDMWMAGISVSQANRITGISYGVIRRVIKLAS
jgi:REP element-mobilizing transposase RayT